MQAGPLKLSLVVFAISSLSLLAIQPWTNSPLTAANHQDIFMADSWHIYLVDSVGQVGFFNSITVDGNGVPHISYYDSTDFDLKYATWDGAGWRVEIVDSAGYVGTDTSIALDSLGRPHISYRSIDSAPQANHLKHAWKTASGWNTEVVDSAYSTGFYTSLAIDSLDRLHVSYYEGFSNFSVNYAHWDGSAWSLEKVESVGGSGTRTSLALDSQDRPHIAFYDGFPDYGIKHVWRDGSAWLNETVPQTKYSCAYASLALDSSDRPHVTYQDSINNNVRYAARNDTAWSKTVIDWAGDACTFSIVAVDGHDDVQVAYSETSNGDLRYGRSGTGGWNIENVDTTGRVATHVSLALDGGDNPHLSYYDEAGFDLKYATKTELPPPPEPLLSFNPPSLDFGTLPPNVVSSKAIEVWNSGGKTLNYSLVETAPWIVGINPASGSSSGEHGNVTVTVDTTGLSPGLHTATISMLSNGGNGTVKVSVNLSAAARRVSLDIDPDTLNLKSKGNWITAYLTVENATSSAIDASSLLLNDVVPPSWWDIQGNETLMVKFDRAAVQAIVTVSDSVDIRVTGQWKDGGSFEAHDTIRVIDPGK